MEKGTKYELWKKDFYDLKQKIEICREMGIDYLGEKQESQESHKEKIEYIVKKIIENPELLRKLDSIKDEFWAEAQKKGILMYSEQAWIPGEKEKIVAKKHLCDETLQTVSGKEIYMTKNQYIPTLVHQKKKIIELNKIY
jgi:hypothetical protein